MLPSDPGYVSPAPEHIRQSQVLAQFLRLNLDPYATHSYSPALIETIEQSVSAGSLTTDPD